MTDTSTHETYYDAREAEISGSLGVPPPDDWHPDSSTAHRAATPIAGLLRIRSDASFEKGGPNGMRPGEGAHRRVQFGQAEFEPKQCELAVLSLGT